jgi:hypothetical protein
MRFLALITLCCSTMVAQDPIWLNKKANLPLRKIVLSRVYISPAAEEAIKDHSGMRLSVGDREVALGGPTVFRKLLSKYLTGTKFQPVALPFRSPAPPDPIGTGFQLIEEPAADDNVTFSGFPLDNYREPQDFESVQRAATVLPKDSDALAGSAGTLVIALDYEEHDGREDLERLTGVRATLGGPDIQMRFFLSAVILQLQPGKKAPKVLWRSGESAKKPGVWIVSVPQRSPQTADDDRLQSLIALCVNVANALRQHAPPQ